METKCALCGRLKPTTFHHLIPMAVYKKSQFVKKFGKKEMQIRGIKICQTCHSGIHDLIPNEKDLARYYNTVDLLLAHEGVAKHVTWASKQK